MSKQPFALSTIARHSPEEQERDYETIRATVMESARGRWFLEEYARRNRNADTKLVLSAIERLERLVRRGAPAATAAVGGEALPGAHGEADSRDANKSPARSEISALAERIQDLAWTMRERGLDPATCDADPTVEAIAPTPIEPAPILHAPTATEPAGVLAAPVRPVSMPLPRAGSRDPLAALKAMTDEERIALFT